MVTFPSQPCSLPRDLFQIKYGSMTKKKKKDIKEIFAIIISANYGDMEEGKQRK